MHARLARLVLITIAVLLSTAAVAVASDQLYVSLREHVLENDARLTSYRYHYEASVVRRGDEAWAMTPEALREADLPVTHTGYYTRDGERRRSIRHGEDGRDAARYTVDILQFDGRSHRKISLVGASWDAVPQATDGLPPSAEELSSTQQQRVERELNRDTYALDNWQGFYSTPVAAFLADDPGEFPTGRMTSLDITEETVDGDRCYRLTAEFTHPEVESIGEIVINADRGYRPTMIAHEYTSRRIEWSLTWTENSDGVLYPSHVVYRRQHTPANEENDKVVSIRVTEFETEVDFSTPEKWRGGSPNWYEAAEQWLSVVPR